MPVSYLRGTKKLFRLLFILCRLAFKLTVIKLGIKTILFQQRFMCAALDNIAVLQHKDQI